MVVKPMENENEVVKEEVTSPQPSEGNHAQAGDKTPPNELLAKLQAERERRRVAEDRAKLLEEENNSLKSSSTNVIDEDYLSDEGKIFKKEISAVKSEVYSIKEQAEREKVFKTFPVLSDKEAEFEEYRNSPENKGMRLDTAAKAFLAENGLLPSPRVGLEKTTGGDRQAPIQGMTTQEVKDLRNNNYKEYVKLLSEDKIKIVD